MGEGRPEEILVGIVCLVLVGLLARRIFEATRTGVIPLYRTRINRDEAGAAKFNFLIAVNGAALALLLFIAADLLLELGIR